MRSDKADPEQSFASINPPEKPKPSGQNDDDPGTASRCRRKSGKSQKADAMRQLLLDAALVVIGEKGYSAATVDEIVEVAGVSKGIAYYYFNSKADIGQCILKERIEEIVERLEAVSTSSLSSSESLSAMLEVIATYIFENKAFGRFFISELWREGRIWTDSMIEYEQRLINIIQKRIELAQSENIIRKDLDPSFGAAAILGMVLTTALYYLNDANPSGLSAKDRKSLFISQVRDFIEHATS